MLLDPDSMMHVAAMHLDELRREAEQYRLASTVVPRWRRVAGRALVSAGFVMLGSRPAPAPVLSPEPCD